MSLIVRMKKVVGGGIFPPRSEVARRFCILILAMVFLVMNGCSVDEVRLVSYSSGAEVKPTEGASLASASPASVPWSVVLGGLSDILTGARKTAIEQRIGYQESRSFTLIHVKRGDRCDNGDRKVAIPGEPAIQESRTSRVLD
jgi:hypothetical protein